MNSWIKSLLIALALGALAFFMTADDNMPVDKKMKYSVHYLVRLEPRDSVIPGQKAIDSTINRIGRRLDAAGYTHKVAISDDGNPDYFDFTITELDDTNRVNNLVVASGLVQFWDMYDQRSLPDLLPAINEATTLLFPAIASNAAKNADTSLSPETREYLAANNPYRKWDYSAVAEIVEPAVSTTDILRVAIKDTAIIGALFRSEIVTRMLPADARYCFGRPESRDKKEKPLASLYILRTNGNQRAPLENEEIIRAEQQLTPGSENPCVFLELNEHGSRIFEEMTTRSIQKPIAIVFSGQVLSAPVVLSPMTGGKLSINGYFTIDEAKDMAIQLRSSYLPTRPEILSSRVTGTEVSKPVKLPYTALFVFGIAFVLALVVFKSLKSTRKQAI